MVTAVHTYRLRSTTRPSFFYAHSRPIGVGGFVGTVGEGSGFSLRELCKTSAISKWRYLRMDFLSRTPQCDVLF